MAARVSLRKEICSITALVSGAVLLLLLLDWMTVRGNDYSEDVPLLLFAWIGAILCFFLNIVARMIFWMISKRSFPWFARICIACIAFVPATLVITPFSNYFWKCRLATELNYVANVESRLLVYHQANGFYPRSLRDISGLATPPGGMSYDTGNGEYHFQLIDAAGNYPDHFSYSSQTHQWIHNGDWP